ncbi:hypothetical protein E2C01_013749 [Portunus trituberculatus]|uniref:Uncharacterized protein n=1 Tax=Portunus trituberculatus TaxID=210409 RepID=A0A5B7DHG5_PORTR|nr:hypothetical protein [Portunus trituberculatus]
MGAEESTYHLPASATSMTERRRGFILVCYRHPRVHSIRRPVRALGSNNLESATTPRLRLRQECMRTEASATPCSVEGRPGVPRLHLLRECVGVKGSSCDAYRCHLIFTTCGVITSSPPT